jgi:1A family penicillin-binding protein
MRRKLIFAAIVLVAIAASAGLYWLLGDLPGPESIATRLSPPSVRLVDRSGRLLYDILPEQGGRHASVPLASIPLALQQATIATEDSAFYSNPGVDVRGILRALWINVRGGETLAGGSTITQQAARNLLLSEEERAERSLRRKLRESFLAWRLSRRYSKSEILTLYLNQTYYGGMAYGVEAAAQTYFGKPASELDLAESALIAGLPQAPGLYNPYTDPQAAEKRRGVVLDLMVAQGYISPEDANLARRERIVLVEEPYPILAPHFVMMVRGQLDSLFPPEELASHPSLVVRTTLDLDWQAAAERAIARQLEALKHSPDGFGHQVSGAALVALDPLTGGIQALVGSPDFFDEGKGGAINMAVSPRQPGSALKPLVYAAAMDRSVPDPWTAATLLLDVSTAFTTHDEKTYTPKNYDGLEHGPVLLREALASSLNIPAVLALDHVGLEPLFRFATRLGITTLDNPVQYDLSLALGGGAVRLLELTEAYAAFANGGYRIQPYSILEITDLEGEMLYQASPPQLVRVMDAKTAWLITDILSDDSARRIGFGTNSILNIGRPAAVKTGTTTNFHDNWTVGYTPDLVVGVWTGNTDYTPMREVSGLTGAAPIWHVFMRSVLEGTPRQPFVQPPGIVQVEVCALSGLLPGAACPYRRIEWFAAGTEPVQPDTLYQQVEIDQATGRLAEAGTPPERRRSITVLDLPPRARAWARQAGVQLLSDLAPAAPANGRGAAAPLQIVSPAENSTFRLTDRFDPAYQRIALEAAGTGSFTEVRLWMDGDEVGRAAAAPYRVVWQITPGRHEVWAQGQRPNGEWVESERITFEVLP